MTRLGPGSRVLIGTCAYVFMAVSVVGGAFFTTMALTTVENGSVSTRASVGKIGPGYGRMQPADFGKPDKVTYSVPYHPQAAPRASRIDQPAPSTIAAPATPAPPMVIARADRSTDSRPDIHRAY
jgi:hypothetical protein